jgi:spore maturation protein CgeB
MRLLIVGFGAPAHIGAHLYHAAEGLGFTPRLFEAKGAFRGPIIIRSLIWRLRGQRPYRINPFSIEVLAACEAFQPEVLISVGIAPLTETALRSLSRRNVRLINYLTDDQWNPAHFAPWFLEGLPTYDVVFNPRHANLASLRAACKQVHYLPFAFAPEVHYPESLDPSERERLYSDVFFAGAADPDRLPYAKALFQSGLKVGIFGKYWKRYWSTRGIAGGVLSADEMRRRVASAALTICLTRRANIDGHSMRSFELSAMRACMLTEDTPDHRNMFGGDGNATLYFNSPSSLVDRCQWLIKHEPERQRLAEKAHKIIMTGKNTYTDRLNTMLRMANESYRVVQSG